MTQAQQSLPPCRHTVFLNQMPYSYQVTRLLCACVQAEDMEAAEAHFERAWKRFGEAEMLIPEADRGKPMKPMQARAAA